MIYTSRYRVRSVFVPGSAAKATFASTQIRIFDTDTSINADVATMAANNTFCLNTARYLARADAAQQAVADTATYLENMANQIKGRVQPSQQMSNDDAKWVQDLTSRAAALRAVLALDVDEPTKA